MCTFTFLYADGHTVKCENVKTAAYFSGGKVDVTEQRLMEHSFPLGKTICLFAEGKSFSVSGDGLRSITIDAQ